MRSLRWLAELCGLSPVDHRPLLASDMVAEDERATEVLAHIGWWARHPEADSNFARANGRMPNASDAEIFAALNKNGYDGLLYTHQREIIGHCFFQRHHTELHGFSVWVSEQYRGGSLMATACFDLMAYASACQGVVRARFGTGPWSDRLMRPLKQCSAGLGWRVRRGGWVEFSANEPKHGSPARDTGQHGTS
jgi:RimJ/RimL family protein N-acetyltransferase